MVTQVIEVMSQTGLWSNTGINTAGNHALPKSKGHLEKGRFVLHLMGQGYPEIVVTIVKPSRKGGANGEDADGLWEPSESREVSRSNPLASPFFLPFSLPLPLSPLGWANRKAADRSLWDTQAALW